MYPYSLSTSIARSAGAYFTGLAALESCSLFVDVHDPLLYVGGFMLSQLMVFVTVMAHAYRDIEDFPRVRQVGYSLGWGSRRSRALAYYG